MANQYQLGNIEIQGDADTATFELVTPKAAVPGAVAGTPLIGEKVTRHNGQVVLFISAGEAGSGDFDIPVLEIEGDVATDDLRLVVPKTEVPEALGQDLAATRVGEGADAFLVAVLPTP